MIKDFLYFYKGLVTKVYDGDTFTIDIDLGLSTWIKGEKIRLHRINAPEVTGKEKPKGIKSRNYLRKLILNKTIYFRSIKDRKEKYGRYLAEVFIEKEGKLVNLNDEMVKKKYAVYKKY